MKVTQVHKTGSSTKVTLSGVKVTDTDAAIRALALSHAGETDEPRSHHGVKANHWGGGDVTVTIATD